MAVGLGLAKAVPSIIEAPEVPWTHSFVDNSILKHATEKAMYMKARYNYDIIGDVTLLAERDVERNILMARDTVACTVDSMINIVEINKNMHNYQVQLMKKIYEQPKDRVATWHSQIYLGPAKFEVGHQYTLKHNVKFIHNNITKVPPTIFMDVDLMGTVKTCGSVLQEVLWKQRTQFPLGTPEKGFIFTLSLRGGGGIKDNIDWILRELVPITGSTCTLGQYESVTLDKDTRRTKNDGGGAWSKRFPCTSIDHPFLKDIIVHMYSDGDGPMLTGLLIYA